MSNKLIGQTVGQYQITEHLGKGGMAEVYKAYQPNLDRYVALKVLHPIVATDEQFLARFRTEARSVATLRHQHIVQIFDFGNEGKTYYMVMEFVDGQTLKQKLNKMRDENKVMSLEEASKLLTQVAQALDYAHERGLIHRDVKPANILLTSGGDAILSDFGIARMVESTRQTMTGVVGTPEYMSPEQGQGKELDARSDIYALGVVLYEMLTGKMPYQADTPLAVIFQHVRDPLPLPSLINADIPEPVERVILKALAKSPENRYSSAGEMAAAMERALNPDAEFDIEAPAGIYEQPPKTSGPSKGPLPSEAETIVPPKPRRNWKRLAIIFVLLLALGGLSAAAIAFGPQVISSFGSKTPTPVEQTGTISEAGKDVKVRPRAGSDWTSAFVGMTLYNGSAIRTPDDAFARVRLDEALLRLAPDSELSLDQLLLQDQNRIVRLNLLRGRVWIHLSSEMIAGDEFSITLPQGQVVLSVGRCSIGLAQDGSALISVDVGRAEVRVGSSVMTVSDEQELRLSASGGLGDIGAIGDEERNLWQNYAADSELSLATPTFTPTMTPTPTDTPLPTATPTATSTSTPTTTPTDTPTPLPSATPTDTPLPTDTPTSAPTPTATRPPTSTPRPTHTPTTTLTPTVTPTYEPLGHFYWDWQTSEVGDGQHWQVYIYFHVKGGDGNYTFYKGEELMGTELEYTMVYGCGFPMMGKFTVFSGDGQNWTKDYYFEDPPCTPQ